MIVDVLVDPEFEIILTLSPIFKIFLFSVVTSYTSFVPRDDNVLTLYEIGTLKNQFSEVVSFTLTPKVLITDVSSLT